MTNELEKTFLDTFGIKPKTIIEPRYSLNTEYYEEKIEKYPQITDRILLELMCILTKFYGELVLEQCLDIKDLKEQVLNIFMRTCYKDNFKHQVHTLFEEEN